MASTVNEGLPGDNMDSPETPTEEEVRTDETPVEEASTPVGDTLTADKPEKSAKAERAEARAARRGQLREYDFRRPSQISRDDLRQVIAYCEQFARRASVTVSSDLSALATVVAPDTVQQLSYEEFVSDLETPAHVLVMNLRSTGGSGLFYLPSRVALALLERKMGGPGDPEQRKRALTEIEVGVVADLLNQIVEDWIESVRPVTNAKIVISRVESNPQLIQAMPGSDIVTVLRFILRLGSLTDEILISIPATFWQEAFKARPRENTPTLTEGQQKARKVLRQRVLDTPVELTLRFEQVPVSLGDVAALEPGKVIPLDALEGEPLVADVAGIPTFAAHWIRDGRRTAMQIESVIAGSHERTHTSEVSK